MSEEAGNRFLMADSKCLENRLVKMIHKEGCDGSYILYCVTCGFGDKYQ